MSDPSWLAIDARGRVSLQREVRRSQAVDVGDVVQQRGEPLLPVPSSYLTHSLDASRRVSPALGPGVVTVGRVPLGRSLPSTASAAGSTALFGGVRS